MQKNVAGTQSVFAKMLIKITKNELKWLTFRVSH